MRSSATERMVAVVVLFGMALAVALIVSSIRTITPAQQASTHCATLDAIAVQTPEGWTCITASVIPAEEP